MKTEKTLFDRIITSIKNTPILASLIVFGVVIIALAKFTTAIEDLGKFFFRRESEQIATILKENDKNLSLANISGKWVTDLVPDVMDEDVTCQRLFNIHQDKDLLFGRMRQMCSDGFDWEYEIKDGKVKNKYISFFVQRGTGWSKRDSQGDITGVLEWKYHKVFYKGSVSDNVIELKVQDERGYPPQSIVATKGDFGKNTK